MSKHKKQHIIPQCYLSVWCDPSTPDGQEPYLWVFSKDGKSVKKKGPKNIFYHNDYYTIIKANGERDLKLESGLSGLEAEYAKIRRTILEGRKLPDDESILMLCAFIAAMDARTKVHMNHWASQWRNLLGVMDEMRQALKRATPEEKRSMRSISSVGWNSNSPMTYNDVKKMAENTVENMLLPLVNVLTPLLYPLDLAVLRTESEPGFITSDNPCVWCDPEAYKRPPAYRMPGLIYDSIEITMPISPSCALLLNRKGKNGVYAILEPSMDEINRRTRCAAGEHFIVNSHETKEIWFTSGDTNMTEL